MSLSRSALRARPNHDAVAAEARLAPGTWVLAGLYPSTSSAAGVARNVEKGRMVHYQPAGSFEARRELTQDGVNIYVRYTGPAQALVKPSPGAKKTAAPRPAGRATSAAPAARLLLTGGPSDPEWHNARRLGICGSDVAALLGLTPSRGPRHVYEEKHGNDVVDETRQMRMGNRLEATIAEMFAEETSLVIEDAPGTLVNRERPWMRGHVDRYVLDASGAVVAPLEVKNRGAYASSDWQDAPPDSVAVQAHWYMGVGGWDHAHVAGLIGGNRLATFRLERDEELITDLIEHCGAWFQRHVLDGFPPPADGLEATAKLLSRLWDVKPEQVAEVDRAEAARLRAEHQALKAEAKDVAARLVTVENSMRLLSGEAAFAEADGQAAWNWKANGAFRGGDFAKEHPELAAQYRHQVDALDTAAIAAAHPALFEKYRSRVLRVPAKGV